MDTDSLNLVKSIGSDSVASTKPSSFEHDAAAFHFEQPNFDLEKVQLQFDLRNDLQRLLVSNNMMYIFKSRSVYRIDLEHPSNVVQIEIPLVAEPTVSNSWLHPSGHFLIIQVNGTHYFHLHSSYSRFKSMPRFKGLHVSCMAFTGLHTKSSTGDFLFTTKDGAVYVALIKCHDPGSQDSKRDDKYVKNVYKAKGDIRGISLANNYSQIQLFVNGELLVWDCFEFVLSEITRDFRQEPTVIPTVSRAEESAFLFQKQNYYMVTLSSFDLLSNDEELLLSNTVKLNLGGLGISNVENSFITTRHNLIFLSSKGDTLTIVNKIASLAPTFKDLSSTLENRVPLGIIRDPIANTNWLYTSDGIFEISISNESVSVWYNYYKIGDYERALRLLDESDPTSSTWFKKNVVLVKQGYDLLQKGGFGVESYVSKYVDDQFNSQVKGIRVLGELQEPFEKVCLMLLNMLQSGSDISILSNFLLVEYLKTKFTYAKEVERNKVKIIVLSSWIIRVFLELIQTIEHQHRLQTSALLPVKSSTQNADPTLEFLKELNSALDKFIKHNYKVFDSRTVYQILTDMNFPEKFLSFADVLEDYEFILNHYMEKEQWLEALKILVKMYTKDAEKACEVVYRSSTRFLIHNPRETVEVWLKFPSLDYEKLLPAILSYNKSGDFVSYTQNPSVHFLLKLVYEKNVRSPVLINYFLTLLITYPSLEDEVSISKSITKALQYVRSDNSTNFRKRVPYDPEFLLRLCLRFKKYHPAILILINDMQVYDAALKIALDNNLISLAEYVLKQYDKMMFLNEENSKFSYEDYYTGNEPKMTNIKLEDDHFASRKKLWMTYAKFLIEEVCKGRKLDILGYSSSDLGLPIKELETDVQSITNGIAASVTGENDNSAGDSDLNKILHYLLLLSNGDSQRSNVLTLKDLLPLFPSNITISNFKEEIVSSLNYYNNSINQLSLEMQESADIAEKLKTQIKESALKEKKGSIYTIIEPGESCSICHKLLVDRNFVVFPNCHHCFHKDCIVRFYLKLKGDYRFKRIFQAFRQTSTVADKAELDSILVKECILCNEKNLNSLDDPLIDKDQNKAEIEEWDL